VHLAVEQISCRFGSIHALSGVSFDVPEGQVVGLIGPNGAGKSTLLECVAGLREPDTGTVRVDGHALDAAARRARLLFLPDGIKPWPDQRAATVLDLAVRVFRGERPWRGEDTLASALGLGDFAHQRMGTLSKGQRKRVLVAFSLLSPRRIVLVDEPFDGLDTRQARALAAVFRQEAERGRTILMSVHAMSQAVHASHWLVLLNDGRVVAEGREADLRARAGVAGGDFDEVFLALT
jgi:ABC-2 type transport system ATP-binding protein